MPPRLPTPTDLQQTTELCGGRFIALPGSTPVRDDGVLAQQTALCVPADQSSAEGLVKTALTASPVMCFAARDVGRRRARGIVRSAGAELSEAIDQCAHQPPGVHHAICVARQSWPFGEVI